MTETTKNAAGTFRIGNTTFDDVDTYRADVHTKMLSRKGPSTIHLAALMGAVVGAPLNFKAYEAIGFHHPKDHNYYNLTFDENGNASGDPRMVDIYEGIKLKGEIDDPLLVYPLNRTGSTDILILDGATRATAISYIVANDPDAFARIPIRVFYGTEQEAMGEMVRRNLSEHNRPLADVEIMRAIKRFCKAGWTKDEIASRLGMDPVKWRATLDNYIKAGEGLIPELVDAWTRGLINRSAAFEAAKAPVEEQETVAAAVNSGSKVKGSDIKKRNAERGDMRYNRTLTTLAEKFSTISSGDGASQLAGFLAAKRLKSKFEGELKAIRDSIIALRDAIDEELNPAEPEGETE